MSDQKRTYAVGCYSATDWNCIHDELTHEGCISNYITTRIVECVDEKKHSDTRAVYLLTDAEAEELKNHSDIKYVHLDIPSNPDVYEKPRAKDLYNAFRYSTNSIQYRKVVSDTGNSLLQITPTSTDINRCGYQLLRCTQRTNPWGNGLSIPLDSRVPYTLDGKHVDVVVGDDGCWHGHPEFQNNTGNGPTNYVGGNVLPGNGTCDLLDLVLDSPYYIDPAWFNANAATRLMTRWDGTTVPTEDAARSWWQNGANRSVAFANIGTVAVDSGYTRDAHCGSNIKKPPVNGAHGTACASQAFGRTLGWAFNANKWTITSIGDVGGLGGSNLANEVEYYFDIIKLFHMHKPINPIYGNKNPTVNSNSWGYSSNLFKATDGIKYYFYRQGASGGTGVAYTPTVSGNTIGGLPLFLNYFTSRLGQEMIPNAMTTAGDEMISSGVIVIASAGNSNQKQVNANHKDFNNYWATTSTATLANSTSNQFGIPTYNTINRRGFPEHIGKTANSEFPVISVGALDVNYSLDNKEQKVDYSNKGNTIDCYVPAEGTLAANCHYPPLGLRPDTYPSISGKFFSDGITGSATASALMTDTTASGAALAYTVTAPGSSFYTFSGSASGNNPTLNVTVGDTLTFNLSVAGHPFWIKTVAVTNTDSGVTTGTITGTNGATSGTLVWNTTGVTPGTYYYICQFHGSMVGTINVQAATTGTQLIIGNIESSAGMLTNTARRITTTSNNTVSVSSITFSEPTTVGLTADSTPSIGMLLNGYDYSNYNGFWDVVLPFNINFGSLQTDKVFINTNSYVTFGTRPLTQNYDWDLMNAYTASEPPMPKIFITAANGTGQKIWTGVAGTTPNRIYQIRFDGSSGYGTASTTSTIIWGMTFYEASPYDIDLHMGINSRISKPTDCDFGGTSSACPVAAGLIATILQENRTWDWRTVKKYLNSALKTQSKNSFYIGKECRNANDSKWSDENSLEGSRPIIIYNPQTNS